MSFKEDTQGLPWRSSCQVSSLPMQGVRVRSLVGNLDSTCYTVDYDVYNSMQFYSMHIHISIMMQNIELFHHYKGTPTCYHFIVHLPQPCPLATTNFSSVSRLFCKQNHAVQNLWGLAFSRSIILWRSIPLIAVSMVHSSLLLSSVS